MKKALSFIWKYIKPQLKIPWFWTTLIFICTTSYLVNTSLVLQTSVNNIDETLAKYNLGYNPGIKSIYYLNPPKTETTNTSSSTTESSSTTSSSSSTSTVQESSSSSVSTSQESATTKNTTPSSSVSSVPREYKNALKTAERYLRNMAFSKKGLYQQLTSEAGEKYPAEAAQYAIDNITVDWNEQALKSARKYQKVMPMSNEELRQQLMSDAGEQFTEEEANYAIEHLEN